MLEAHLQSGQIVSFDGRVLEIFQPSQPSGRYHVDQLAAPVLSEKADGGCELMLGDVPGLLAFARHELLLARRLVTALAPQSRPS
jgi:hypothetical protein